MDKYLNLEGLEYLCGKMKNDLGTVEGGVSLLDDLNKQGTYNWLDTNGEMGFRGGLWNVSVSNSAYRGAHPSVTQTLLGTYGKGTKGRVLTRASYYANSPQWTPWRELVSLDQAPGTNLLDNWYFLRPVNQRNQQKYTTAGYTIDRWYSRYGSSAAHPQLSVTVEDGAGLTLSEDPVTLEQPTEYNLANQQITVSVLTAEGILRTWTATLGENNNAAPGWSGELNLVCFNSGAARNTQALGIRLYNNAKVTIAAVKLERGPMQTLARKEGDAWVLNDPPPDPALELAKCQRYYVNSQRSIQCLKSPSFNLALANVVFPVKMRARPTVSIRSYINTPNTLGFFGSGLDSEITASVNTPYLSPEGFNALDPNKDLGETTIYVFKYEASAEL